MGTKKDAKEISKRISLFMQENKYTLSDITRGMVVLENLERDFLWSNGVVKPVKVPKEKPVKKKEAVVELAECTS